MTEEFGKPLPRRILEAISWVSGHARGARQPSAPAVSPGAPTVFRRTRIHLICYEELDAWILGKITRRLGAELTRLGMDVTLGQIADPSAEVNHHVVYFDYERRAPTLETVMVTHIDTDVELAKIRHQLVELDADMGICMSFEAVHRLAHFGVPRHKLCFIGPAHDEAIKPRKVVVGLTTRLYPDRRKREQLLTELAKSIDPAEFEFRIMGSGWEAIVAELRASGFVVDYFDRFEESRYRELIRSLDYYLYLGQDEGSMGFLDALAAAVPTIVTPQGFHLDVPGGITHPFVDLPDLRRVFEQIAEERRRRCRSVEAFTWPEFARKHLLVWEYLRARKQDAPVPEPLGLELEALALVASPR